MDSFDLQKAKKLSFLVVTVFIGYVVVFMGLFHYMHVTYMVYHSIPTIIGYLIMYALIAKNKLHEFVVGVYFILTAYMGATTVCLGVEYGFQLYMMSMLPIVFYTEYMGFRLHAKRIRSLWICLFMICCYLICSGYAVYIGPIYEGGNDTLKVAIFTINSGMVFGFLITYTQLLLSMITGFQKQLLNMAHNDKLTGLYNRHYMIEYMNQLEKENHFVAMLDIDHFKKINDTYGHDCGDFVLVQISKIMKETCEGCIISRWGGEEFLFVGKAEMMEELPEKLRSTIEKDILHYGDTDIQITVTIGVEEYLPGYSQEQWIQKADQKLYEGKGSGRNRVIF